MNNRLLFRIKIYSLKFLDHWLLFFWLCIALLVKDQLDLHWCIYILSFTLIKSFKWKKIISLMEYKLKYYSTFHE